MAIHLRRLWLTDFRSYHEVDVSLPSGTTAIVGANGQGKTNLLEAVAWLAGSSLRGASPDTLVRVGCDRAVLRAEATRGPRDLLVEADLPVRGRTRVQLNKQPVRRQRDLLEVLAVTLFSPEDLVLVKGGPAHRRDWLDDALVALDHRHDSLCSDLDRILRQRNALLKSAKGRLDEAASLTLEVWDERLARTGGDLVDVRRRTLAELTPGIGAAYADIAGRGAHVGATYATEWGSNPGAGAEPSGPALAVALAAARGDDVRRGVTTTGPHRDDVVLHLDGLPSRTHASQGEQRTLALALRLAVHRAVRDSSGESPILLLDDVLSELDDHRAHALLTHLPAGQTLLTTAGALPGEATPERVLRIADGGITVVR